jgi:hypothetical protein
VLEDTTGEIQVIGSGDVQADDVVGVTGTIREGSLFMKKISWPGIPEPNPAKTKPDMTVLLATFLDESIKRVSEGFELVFITQDTGTGLPEDEQKKIISQLPNPCFATIVKDGTEFNLLVYKPEEPATPETVAGFLKRRHLPYGIKRVAGKQDQMIIDPVPDLVWVISNTRHVGSYMGVDVLISGGKDAIRYDTRERRASFCLPPGTVK